MIQEELKLTVFMDHTQTRSGGLRVLEWDPRDIFDGLENVSWVTSDILASGRW